MKDRVTDHITGKMYLGIVPVSAWPIDIIVSAMRSESESCDQTRSEVPSWGNLAKSNFYGAQRFLRLSCLSMSRQYVLMSSANQSGKNSRSSSVL